jgi:uncharacterized protein YecE (DUF72 family)
MDAPGTARVGCSGWLYRDWRGVVYPAGLTQKQWFAWYASHFDTVELNTTFYRLPTVKTVETWRQAAPEGFLYATKLGAFATHRKRLRDPETWLANHLDRVERLQPALGPTLVQLRPRWPRDVGRLDHFLELAPRAMRWAVELRDASWLHDDVFETLRRHDAALCVHDLLADHPYVVTTDWTYVRFHGPDALRDRYHGSYGRGRLAPWADRLAEELTAGRDVYCFFNNDYGGNAVDDALALRGLLGERT